MNDNGIRNHFSTVFVNTFKTIWYILIFLIVELVNQFNDLSEDIQGMDGSAWGIFIAIAAGAVLLVLLIGFIFNFLRWRKTYIVIDDENLIVNKNFLINKKSTTVRLSGIATVNFQQGIPERIFGTYKLEIDINSSVTADKTDFNLVFSKPVAEEIKQRLTKHLDEDGDGIKVSSKSVNGENGDSSVANHTSNNTVLIRKFNTLHVMRHCALSTSILLILISVLIAGGSILASAEEDISGGNPLAFILPSLLIIVPLLWSMIAPILNYQNFKIEKIGNRAVVSYGFFTRRQYNVPLDKTNAIIIHQPLFARMFGYCYGEILTVGMGDQEKDNTPIFCLMVTPDEMKKIISELRPDLLVNGFGESSPMKSYVSVCIPYLLFGVGVIVGLGFFDLWWLGLPVLAFMMFIAWLSVKTKALAVLNDKTVITSGVFHKKTVIVPNKKIQNVAVETGPISRKLGLSKGVVTVLADKMHMVHPTGYFSMDRFDRMFEKIIYMNSDKA